LRTPAAWIAAGAAEAAVPATAAASKEFVSMQESIGPRRVLVIGARAEPAAPPVGGGGSTPAAMTARARPLTVCCVAPSRPPVALRAFAVISVLAILASVLFSEPHPGVSDEGLAIAVALVALVCGLIASRPWGRTDDRTRFAGIATVGAASIALTALQPDGAGYAGVYFVVVVAAARLPRTPALVVGGATLVGEVVALALTRDVAAAHISGLLFSVLPWFFVMRLLRELRIGRDRAEALVEELEASRAAQVQAAALAERGRLARDMHDVLAHSLSALALQLEGARLLAHDRDTDPDVVAAVERAHHLAADGLGEARAAIGALRGDEMPGPERLRALAEGFGDRATLTVTGKPRELASEARLAIYRTAQEALTNVVRHSAAERVALRLAYEPGGTRLTVEDSGAGVPVPAGASPGGGYGITGMRERAELLGGRLDAGPTPEGFRVELWLPA
jgi:signal transduction histidine kinase